MEKILSSDFIVTKKGILILITLAVSIIIASASLLNYLVPLGVLGYKSVLTIIIVENSLTGFGCLWIARNLTWSVVRRNNATHFVNLPSVALAFCFLYSGLTMIADIMTIYHKFYWVAIIIRLITVVIIGVIAVETSRKINYLVNMPDITSLLEANKKLQRRINVLKATNPYSLVDAEMNDPQDLEEVIQVIKKVSNFLQEFEKSTY